MQCSFPSADATSVSTLTVYAQPANILRHFNDLPYGERPHRHHRCEPQVVRIVGECACVFPALWTTPKHTDKPQPHQHQKNHPPIHHTIHPSIYIIDAEEINIVHSCGPFISHNITSTRARDRITASLGLCSDCVELMMEESHVHTYTHTHKHIRNYQREAIKLIRLRIKQTRRVVHALSCLCSRMLSVCSYEPRTSGNTHKHTHAHRTPDSQTDRQALLCVVLYFHTWPPHMPYHKTLSRAV